jgi:hypothetical protein
LFSGPHMRSVGFLPSKVSRMRNGLERIDSGCGYPFLTPSYPSGACTVVPGSHRAGVTCVSRSRQHAGNRSATWPWVIGIGPVWDGVGAPCVTEVLDGPQPAGDYNRDWLTPGGERSRQCTKAAQHECWRARRWQELTA